MRRSSLMRMSWFRYLDIDNASLQTEMRGTAGLGIYDRAGVARNGYDATPSVRDIGKWGAM